MSELYDIDPHAWAMDQADRLRGIARSSPRLDLDFPHLIEELDGMAAADRHRVENLADAIVQHLLLLEHSPASDPRRHWQAELVQFRSSLRRLLTQTLRAHLAEHIDRVFDSARDVAPRKMELYGEPEAAQRLPEHRPHTLEQILDLDFLPG